MSSEDELIVTRDGHDIDLARILFQFRRSVLYIIVDERAAQIENDDGPAFGALAGGGQLPELTQRVGLPFRCSKLVNVLRRLTKD